MIFMKIVEVNQKTMLRSPWHAIHSIFTAVDLGCWEDYPESKCREIGHGARSVMGTRLRHANWHQH